MMMNKKLLKVVLYSFVGWFCGVHAYPYAHQELYNTELDMKVHLIYDYHEDIADVKHINKALIDGFCALDKKSEEPIKLLWELDTDYWRSCANASSGHCMIPVGMKLSKKLNNAVSFIEADNMRHTEPLVFYDDFMCKKWYQADEDDCPLDEVLSMSTMQDLETAFNSAHNFLDLVTKNNNDFPAVSLASIEHNAARKYAQKTWHACTNRIKGLCCSNQKNKSDYIHTLSGLKEDLFTGVADLEFFTKLWTSPESCQIIYAGGAHCDTMAETLGKLGFEEVAACGTEQYGIDVTPDLLKPKKLFALLQA